MPPWRTVLIVVATLGVLLSAAEHGRAQEAAQPQAPMAVEAPASAAPAPEPETPEDKTVAAFDAALETWANQIKTQEQAIADPTTMDEELRAIPDTLEALRATIEERRAQLKPKLQDARERLAKLGPAPKDGAPPESAEIARQRKKLDTEVADLDGKLKQADLLFVRAGQLIDAANDERRERFTESLFSPVPNFYAYVLPAAFERLPMQVEQRFEAIADWLARAWSTGVIVFLLVFIAPIGAFLGTHSFVRNMAARVDAKQRPNRPAEPTIQDRGIWALRKTVRSALPFWMGLAAFYLIATAAGLADPSLAGFLPRTVLASAWAVSLIFLIRHSLVPEDDAWKLIPSAPAAMSWRIAGLLWAVVTIWLLDHILGFADVVVFAPYQVTVLRSTFFAALYGILIAATLWVIQSGSTTRKGAFTGWQGWLFTFVGVVAGLILLAALLGYESLASFMGTHAVSTAGVLWTMYLVHLAAESISSVSVISGRAIDDDIDEDEDMGGASLFTIRIIVSLLLDITILAIGSVILLLLWRFDWIEVKGWIQAAFFGFQFGNLRISLQSVLVALGVFALGLALTRFVQRWLTARVFTGRHVDTGLGESMRIGTGYLGFVLSALAGISYLGFDFSNIALVAGALSVGIGFGLQSIFNNFVSGLILLVERPIKIGDYIEVGGEEGTVKRISVRSTEIETIHRQSVIIPNATLITDPVTNWMHLDKSCRLDIPIGVDYGTDMELLRSTLLAVAQGHRGVLKSPPPVVHFAGFGDSSLDFELRVFLRDVRERIKSSSDLRFAILGALREAGISIPFPQRDLHIKDMAAPVQAAPRARQRKPSSS